MNDALAAWRYMDKWTNGVIDHATHIWEAFGANKQKMDISYNKHLYTIYRHGQTLHVYDSRNERVGVRRIIQ